MFNFFGKNRFRRGDEPHMLAVGMTGVRLGERFAQVGCADGGRLAAIAKVVGLSGRAIAFVPDAAAAERARKGAARAGVLVEIETAPPTRLPAEDSAFDLVILDDTGGLVTAMDTATRGAALGEARRILRSGGRVMVIGSGPRTGLAGLLARTPAVSPVDAAPALKSGGFNAVRHLAERDGLIFVEGIKPRP
jgi:ubiquinone/menaquinone biosynthesis C-methylase UbiE